MGVLECITILGDGQQSWVRDILNIVKDNKLALVPFEDPEELATVLRTLNFLLKSKGLNIFNTIHLNVFCLEGSKGYLSAIASIRKWLVRLPC